MKNHFTLFLLLTVVQIICLSKHTYGQNILPLDNWVSGNGSITFFNQNGQTQENSRNWGHGPGNNRAILWKATPEGNSNDDGGWNTNGFPIDHTKMYRFSVWLKKTNSHDGQSYFGCGSVLELNGQLNDNPYFWYGDLPQLDKWYLLIGYIHASNDDSIINYGGIYDENGLKIQSIKDFKFQTSTTSTIHRSYLYYDPNINDRQYFYAPRVDIVNGNEPSIHQLLPSYSANVEGIIYTKKIGVNTPNLDNYELAVNGEIKAKEVRVESNWSDFVFDKDYKLKSLKEVEDFIAQNKHLPDIPSEAEITKNGVNIGSINSKLLMKIEELTLYIIKINKELEQLKRINK